MERNEEQRNRARSVSGGSAPIAPRHKFVKLAFPAGTETSAKDAWFDHLHKSVGTLGTDIVRPSNPNSPFIYVARTQADFIDSLTTGRLGGINFRLIETSNNQGKPKEYLVTKYPKDLPIANAHRLDGVLKVRRYMKEGRPLDQVLITWSKDYPPPEEYYFNGRRGGPSYIREWFSTPTTRFNCVAPRHLASACCQPPQLQRLQATEPQYCEGTDRDEHNGSTTTTTGRLHFDHQRHNSIQEEHERHVVKPVGENRPGWVSSGQGQQQQRPPGRTSAGWSSSGSSKRFTEKPLDKARQLIRQQWDFPKNLSQGRGQSMSNEPKK